MTEPTGTENDALQVLEEIIRQVIRDRRQRDNQFRT
jgi:hypothetical protein